MMTFGVADFAVALAGRSLIHTRQILAITALQQTVSLIPLAIAVIFVVEGNADWGDFGWAITAGLTLGIAKPLLYAGLTFGSIVIFAPLVGVLSIIIPFTVSISRGETLGMLGFLGVVVAIPAIVLISIGKNPNSAHWSMLRTLTVASATGIIFALGSLAIGEMDAQAGIAPALVSASVAVGIILSIFRVKGQPIQIRSKESSLAALAGLLEGIGFAFFVLALQQGLVSVTSALAAMTPLVVVALAWLLIHEPLQRLQTVGIGLALIAVLALSLN